MGHGSKSMQDINKSTRKGNVLKARQGYKERTCIEGTITYKYTRKEHVLKAQHGYKERTCIQDKVGEKIKKYLVTSVCVLWRKILPML